MCRVIWNVITASSPVTQECTIPQIVSVAHNHIMVQMNEITSWMLNVNLVLWQTSEHDRLLNDQEKSWNITSHWNTSWLSLLKYVNEHRLLIPAKILECVHFKHLKNISHLHLFMNLKSLNWEKWNNWMESKGTQKRNQWRNKVQTWAQHNVTHLTRQS